MKLSQESIATWAGHNDDFWSDSNHSQLILKQFSSAFVSNISILSAIEWHQTQPSVWLWSKSKLSQNLCVNLIHVTWITWNRISILQNFDGNLFTSQHKHFFFLSFAHEYSKWRQFIVKYCDYSVYALFFSETEREKKCIIFLRPSKAIRFRSEKLNFWYENWGNETASEQTHTQPTAVTVHCASNPPNTNTFCWQ